MNTTWSSKIPDITNRTRQQLSALVETAAYRIELQAKIAAPVDTGFLQTSIETQKIDELTALVSVGAEYGIYVEMGTTRMPAQPYFLPAFEQVVRSLGGEIERVF